MSVKYNWDQIELDYVKGIDRDGKNYFPTKIELAEIHGVCDPEYLRSFARTRGWDAKRQAFLLQLEFSDGETTIPDPKKELESFNVRTYQIVSNTLTLIAKEMKNTKNHNFQDLIIMIKLLEKVQLIGKNSFTEMSDEFEKAKGEFEQLMKKLRKDEKAVSNPPASLPTIETIDLTDSSP